MARRGIPVVGSGLVEALRAAAVTMAAGALLGASAMAKPFDAQAPFRGLEGVSASGDGRGVWLKLSTRRARLLVPGHTGVYQLPGGDIAGLVIACRIPGPADTLGPDPGYTEGRLALPDHPEQSDAWTWIDPRHWIAKLAGRARERWPVEVRFPGAGVDREHGPLTAHGVLERQRATYWNERPDLHVLFTPHALIRWLARQTGRKAFTIEARGDDTAVTLHLATRPGQAEALRRMTALCPGGGRERRSVAR